VDSSIFLSFPAALLFWNCGSGRDEEPSGGKALRLIRIRYNDVEFGKNLAKQSRQFAASANLQFEFHKRRQLFIRVHNETLSVVAMRVCNPDRSPVGINR